MTMPDQDPVASLLAACEPFINYVDPHANWLTDDSVLTKGSPLARKQITAGNFRRLAEAAARLRAITSTYAAPLDDATTSACVGAKGDGTATARLRAARAEDEIKMIRPSKETHDKIRQMTEAQAAGMDIGRMPVGGAPKQQKAWETARCSICERDMEAGVYVAKVGPVCFDCDDQQKGGGAHGT